MNSLSIIVPCRDEAAIIADKVANCRALQTGGLDVELLVADDHSSDDSVMRAKAAGARVICSEAPAGKWNAVAFAAGHARGRILCVSDADAIVDADAIPPAMELFRNPRVGAVSGVRRTLRRDAQGKGIPGGGLYDRVRRVLMQFYSAIDSTPTLHGPLMFFRRELLLRVECHVRADDIDVPMQIRLQGHQAKICGRSRFTELEPVAEEKGQNARRRALGVVQAYWKYRSVLFSRKLGLLGMVAYPMEFFFFLISPLVVLGLLPAAVAATLWDDIIACMNTVGGPTLSMVAAASWPDGMLVILEQLGEGIEMYLFDPGVDDLLGMLAAGLMASDEAIAYAKHFTSIRSRMVQMTKAIVSYFTDPGSVGMSWKPQRREAFRPSASEE